VQDERKTSDREPYVFSTTSDSEVLLPLFEEHEPEEVIARLDGMFALVVASTDGQKVTAARDPCGIKPLYRGWSDSGRVIFASELKCLVGQVDYAEEFPAGHLWTSDRGYQRYFRPAWLTSLIDPEGPKAELPTGDLLGFRAVLKAAVQKRLMSDVGYGFLLSGGVDSAVVTHLMSELTDMSKIKSFTVGMPNSPDVMAARAVATAYGTDHYEYLFTPEEAFAIVPKVVEHLETYEPELIRSAIPNYFLARLAAEHTKVVLTGEGADELLAGYLYFRECPTREAMHMETLRIWGHLHNVNLQRADRMCMAHGLEARVPFLDVDVLAEAYGKVDPKLKMHTKMPGEPPRPEKWAMRSLFMDSKIPPDVLWRTKAMQCEGVGANWVAQLQAMCNAEISDEVFAGAAETFPLNTPHSKEEYYYRELFEHHFKGMDKFVHVWEGGCRAGGASWKSAAYTRAGLVNTSQLKHALMAKEDEVKGSSGTQVEDHCSTEAVITCEDHGSGA
jgi:asparagine synthase (glutamine-hydrolysing)